MKLEIFKIPGRPLIELTFLPTSLNHMVYFGVFFSQIFDTIEGFLVVIL